MSLPSEVVAVITRAPASESQRQIGPNRTKKKKRKDVKEQYLSYNILSILRAFVVASIALRTTPNRAVYNYRFPVLAVSPFRLVYR